VSEGRVSGPRVRISPFRSASYDASAGRLSQSVS
jgi:hypothetical protein